MAKARKRIEINYLRTEYAVSEPPQRARIIAINEALGDRPEALTAIRLRGTPMALLLDRGDAGGEELEAAQEIERAFMAITKGANLKAPSFEKRDPTYNAMDWGLKTIQAVRNYQTWANHWSIRRNKYHDYTLECVISAVIDQRPIRTIADDIGFHHTRIAKAVINGLRDYAARAGWVDHVTAGKWMVEAERVFG